MFGIWNLLSLDVVTAKQTEFSPDIPDRQTQCYPINSSTYRTLTGQNFSMIVEIGLQRAINVILTTLQRFRSLCRATDRVQVSVLDQILEEILLVFL